MSIADNITKIKDQLPSNVQLVAVSKFHPSATVMQAYSAGHRLFGENKMQELEAKQGEMPTDIQWHFIGHLQRNKVKAILPYTHTIQSVDSARLYHEIVKQANALQKPVNCLLQIYIANEDTKYGFSFEECRQLLDRGDWKSSKYARITGVMGMATNTNDLEQVRKEFRELKHFFDQLQLEYFSAYNEFKDISMGMSNDYRMAIEEGATLIRVGSSIFGEREY